MKIVTIESLLGIGGILCHGVFDVLHIGHLEHLRQAKKMGSPLVVSVTADAFVNKGPGRPLFSAIKRAEMLAALDIVDYVVINDAADARPMIEALQPIIYAKGVEYEAPDVTGAFTLERDAVERHGGEVRFTVGETSSSSRLINANFSVHEEETAAYLRLARANGMEAAALAALDRVADLTVAVIGEAIIDEYVYVETLGRAAKESILATRRLDTQRFAGGAVAVANTLAAHCDRVNLVSIIGDDGQGGFLAKQCRENIEPIFIRQLKKPTVRKTRFIDSTYMRKLFEVYDLDDTPAEIDTKDLAPFMDIVVVSDFGHGMINHEIVHRLMTEARFLAVNTQTNAGNHGFNLIDKYSRADVVCVDAPEARLATRKKHAPAGVLAGMLEKHISSDNIFITDGRRGCWAGDIHIPAFATHPVDTMGAGDVFFALASLCMAAGASREVAGFIGNVAAAMKVEIVGHSRTIDRPMLIKAIKALLA